MIDKFNDLPWHDAEINHIIIDRQKDSIRIEIRWPDYANSELVLIEFLDCYGLKSVMNFVVAPPDQILGAECLLTTPDLDDLRSRWMGIIDFSSVYCYRIKTNSTNSKIDIYAKSFSLKVLS